MKSEHWTIITRVYGKFPLQDELSSVGFVNLLLGDKDTDQTCGSFLLPHKGSIIVKRNFKFLISLHIIIQIQQLENEI